MCMFINDVICLSYQVLKLNDHADANFIVCLSLFLHSAYNIYISFNDFVTNFVLDWKIWVGALNVHGCISAYINVHV